MATRSQTLLRGVNRRAAPPRRALRRSGRRRPPHLGPVPLGLLVAVAAAGYREEGFFPASMVIVGAHYLLRLPAACIPPAHSRSPHSVLNAHGHGSPRSRAVSLLTMSTRQPGVQRPGCSKSSRRDGGHRANGDASSAKADQTATSARLTVATGVPSQAPPSMMGSRAVPHR